MDGIFHDDIQISGIEAGYAARGLRDFCEPYIPQNPPRDIREWRTRDVNRSIEMVSVTILAFETPRDQLLLT